MPLIMIAKLRITFVSVPFLVRWMTCVSVVEGYKAELGFVQSFGYSECG